jgi:hypothetical protein
MPLPTSGISVNDVANTASTTIAPQDTSNALKIGTGGVNELWDGVIDEVAFYKRVLTPAERTWLYNNGAGHSYADLKTNPGTAALVSWWSLNQADGTRTDSHTFGNHLTDNNTVTSATGLQGNAASFAKASQESLSIPDNAALSTGNIDYTLAGWVYLSSKSTTMTIASKYGATWPASLEYTLVWHQTYDRFVFIVGDGTNTNWVHANAFGSPATGQWYFVAAWHNATTHEIGISVNNVLNTASTTIIPGDNGVDFRIGAGGPSGEYWDGRIDEVAFTSAVCARRSARLYSNNGGRTYAGQPAVRRRRIDHHDYL